MKMTAVDSTRLVDTLKNLGLTKYEALVYIGLLGMQEGTATEIHELSTVPRASVYPTLNRLIRKNLVSISHTVPRRYKAIPPEEGVNHLLDRIEGNAIEAKEALHQIQRKPARREGSEGELIWSIYGREHIIDRLVDLIKGARQDIHLIAYWDLLEGEVAKALLSLPQTVEIEVICDRWEDERHFPVTILNSPVQSIRDSIPPCNMAGVFCIDGKQALVSMGSGKEQPSALFSESVGFFQFFSRYYRFITEWNTQHVQ